MPRFQRPLRWEREDVLALFDSIRRGYPIGSLLLWQREAPAEVVTFAGVVQVDAPLRSAALWVVDGQQRVTSLVAALLHPDPEHASDKFALFFDLQREELVARGTRAVQPWWLPLNRVVDSERLLGWLDEYPGPREHRASAIRLGKLVREYEIPA